MAAFTSIAATQTRKSHRIAGFVVWFLVVFNVLFPKGGFKIGDVPYTWGYLFLGATLIPLAIVRFAGGSLRMRRNTLIALASQIPFQILVIYSFRQYGIASFGFLASMVVGLYILPFAFLVVYPGYFRYIDGVKLASLLRRCIFWTAVFGIFLFFYYAITRQLIEIPYLTVNAEDYGMIELTKHINRGSFLKLISTYNNGNLYGVAMIILLPLYNQLEPKTWKRIVLKVALVLTLSRSVWLGLVMEQLLSLVRIGWDSAKTFPRLALGPTINKALLIIATAGAVLVGLFFVSGGLSFLFDPQLGGRSNYISDAARGATILPTGIVYGFLEIIYATALQSYGILGLISFVLIFLTPIFLLLTNRTLFHSPLRLAACKGLILYMIVAGADGGLLLIPILAFYWFAYMVFLEGWPGNLDMIPRPREGHPVQTR